MLKAEKNRRAIEATANALNKEIVSAEEVMRYLRKKMRLVRGKRQHMPSRKRH